MKLMSVSGENLYENYSTSFDMVVRALLAMLKSMGIDTNTRDIKTAIVKKIDIGKNFFSPEDSFCREVIALMRTSTMAYRRLLKPEDCYNGVKFYSNGSRTLGYNKLEEMLNSKYSLPRERKLANDLINSGLSINSIFRIEEQHRTEYAMKKMLERFYCNKNEITFQEVWYLPLHRELDYALETLEKNLPNMLLESNMNEEIKSLYKTDNARAKAAIFLNLQQQGKSYEEAKIEAGKLFSKNFMKTYAPPLLIPNEDRRLILPIFQKEVKDYKALTPDILTAYLDDKSKQKIDTPKTETAANVNVKRAVMAQGELFPGNDYFACLKRISMPNTAQRELFSDNEYSAGPKRTKQGMRESIGK
ncbi:MAG: hypothetical protein FWG57_02570 [Endomicrobia bacterium]|nr:hypothetical protein [Endomicrobiia bacterium]